MQVVRPGTMDGYEIDAACRLAQNRGLLAPSESQLLPDFQQAHAVAITASREPAPTVSPSPESRTPITPPSPAPVVPVAPKSPPAARVIVSTGSGFFVNSARVITNQHVVAECGSVSLRFGDELIQAKVLAVTAKNDLALLSTTMTAGVFPAIRSSAKLGEDVTVAGYPLSGLLSNDLIVTSGQVNSLAGMANDPSILQISAPVQPGNSGGPLIDRSGAIVGVVVSKLDVARLSKVTGDFAQNINFAVKSEVLRLFLDANRVQYRNSNSTQRLDGIKIAERARQFTVQVYCEK